MAVLGLQAAPRSSSTRANVAGEGAAPAERPVAQYYLNIGVTLDVEQADGTTTQEFISIPVGLALDNPKPMEYRGSNDDWLNKVQVKNALLAKIQRLATEQAPGSGEVIEDLQVQVFRRKADTAAPAASANPLMSQLAALGFATE